ncbi:serine/threonine-protein kinase RUNKEL-like, partial [Penaeus japonicus]|uniref:serine/threonine-protein kinase RUNKEL-like n=1 Tax=Penaeus japonicus TaxID=27405 RepID=UPI001C70B857
MVTEALEEIHAKGIVHCDLKTDNVVLVTNRKNTVRSVSIIDLGLGRHEGGQHKKKSDRGRNRPWYCDCYYTGEAMTPACDLVGLGVLFEDMFKATKSVPLVLRNMASRMRSSDHAQRPQISEVKKLLQSFLPKGKAKADKEGEAEREGNSDQPEVEE